MELCQISGKDEVEIEYKKSNSKLNKEHYHLGYDYIKYLLKQLTINPIYPMPLAQFVDVPGYSTGNLIMESDNDIKKEIKRCMKYLKLKEINVEGLKIYKGEEI